MIFFILALGIGLFAGVSSGVFGIGGGVVIIPLLVFILKYKQIEAVGTSLIALLLPVGSLGVFHYYRNGFVNLAHVKIGLMISLGMVLGTFFGAKIASGLDSRTLSKLFAIFLFLISIKVWRG